MEEEGVNGDRTGEEVGRKNRMLKIGGSRGGGGNIRGRDIWQR